MLNASVYLLMLRHELHGCTLILYIKTKCGISKFCSFPVKKTKFYYPAISSIGWDTVYCGFLFLCTVTDFSARALPIGMKFCMAVRPNLGQVFSHFGGIAPGMAKLWASTGAIWRDMLLAEAIVDPLLNPSLILSIYRNNFNIFRIVS